MKIYHFLIYISIWLFLVDFSIFPDITLKYDVMLEYCEMTIIVEINKKIKIKNLFLFIWLKIIIFKILNLKIKVNYF